MDTVSTTSIPVDRVADTTRNRTVLAGGPVLTGTLREGGERVATRVRVRNLSSGGLMAEHWTRYQRGTSVEIELHGAGVVAGTIAWALEGRIGIAFDEPIDPGLVVEPVDGQQP